MPLSEAGAPGVWVGKSLSFALGLGEAVHSFLTEQD